MRKKGVVESHFDEVAKDYDYYKRKSKYYYDNLKKLLGNLIPKNKKVFEVGCGTGDLIAYLKPSRGYGMDLSAEMIKIANSKHSKESQIKFATQWPKEKFEYVFMSDVIEHLENPGETFNKIAKLMDSKSIFINTMANPIWEPVLLTWEYLGLKMPEGKHKRLSFNEIEKILGSCGLEVTKHDFKLLIPINIPILTSFVNKFLERPLRRFAFIEYFVAERRLKV